MSFEQLNTMFDNISTIRENSCQSYDTSCLSPDSAILLLKTTYPNTSEPKPPVLAKVNTSGRRPSGVQAFWLSKARLAMHLTSHGHCSERWVCYATEVDRAQNVLTEVDRRILPPHDISTISFLP